MANANGTGAHGAGEFWSIWNAYEPRLRQLCLRICRKRPDDAEDALREAMTRAWDHWEDEGRTLQNPEAWLYTLTRNAALTWHRKEKTRAKLMPEVYSRQKRPNEPLDEVVHRKLLTEHALRAIDAMPPRVRERFRSYVFDEQSYEEIAHRHGLTVSAARLRVQMGFRYLRQLYEGERLVHWDGDEDLADRLTAHLSTIAYAMNDTEVVQVRLPGGGVLEYHSVFEQTVKRRQQRIGTLCNYVANHERGWRKRFELANLLIAENRMEEAEEQLRSVLAIQPRHLFSALRLGRMLALQRRVAEAAEVYQTAQSHLAPGAARHHLEGLRQRTLAGGIFPQYAIAQREEHFALAVGSFEAAIAAEPRNLAHYHELAMTYEMWGKPVEAAAAYDAALKVDPDDVFALARSHNSLTAQGLYNLVLPRLERAVALDPNYAYALKLLVDRRASLGLVRGKEGRRTLELARRLVGRNPSSADAYDAFTRYYEMRGEYEHVVVLWRDFLSRNPESARGWTFFGTALERCGDDRGAAEAYLRSWELDPDWLDVYWRGLPILARAGRHVEARQWIVEIAHRFPNQWSLCHRIAEALLAMGEDAESALAYSRRAVELAPDLEVAWRDHGTLLLKAGRPADALQALAQAWELALQSCNPHALWTRLMMVRTLKALGRPDEADEVLREFEQRARECAVQSPAYAHFPGYALLERGEHAAAERAFRAALKAGNTVARDGLRELADNCG